VFQSLVASLRLCDLGYNEEALLLRNIYIIALKTLVEVPKPNDGHGPSQVAICYIA
jgi:hypothetical protein